MKHAIRKGITENQKSTHKNTYKHRHEKYKCIYLLQQSNHQPLIIPTRLTPNPSHQISLISILISLLNLIQMRAVPMHPDDPHDQFLILGAHTLHALLEGDSIAHRRIQPRAQHVEQGVFHVSGELALDMFLEGGVVALGEGVVDGAEFVV